MNSAFGGDLLLLLFVAPYIVLALLGWLLFRWMLRGIIRDVRGSGYDGGQPWQRPHEPGA